MDPRLLYRGETHSDLLRNSRIFLHPDLSGWWYMITSRAVQATRPLRDASALSALRSHLSGTGFLRWCYLITSHAI
jgi:hypothetical protein